MLPFFSMGAGSGFCVHQVILPLGPAILVFSGYCVHRICSLRKFLGGWGSSGTYIMRQAAHHSPCLYCNFSALLIRLLAEHYQQVVNGCEFGICGNWEAFGFYSFLSAA